MKRCLQGDTHKMSSAATDLYKRKVVGCSEIQISAVEKTLSVNGTLLKEGDWITLNLSLIRISEPTRRHAISYAVSCLKKKPLIHFSVITFRYPIPLAIVCSNEIKVIN